jgi:hypothetical protein
MSKCKKFVGIRSCFDVLLADSFYDANKTLVTDFSKIKKRREKKIIV